MSGPFKVNQRTFSLFATALLLTGPISSASAANTAWKNASLGDWTIATNWTNDTRPNQNIGAVIANGGTALINTNLVTDAFGLFIGIPTAAGATGTLQLTGNLSSLYVWDQIRIGWSTTPGVVSNGTLFISAGADLSQQGTSATIIGDGDQGSTGTVTVTGGGSQLSTTTFLVVGTGNSHGFLNLQNGGELDSGGSTLIAATSGSTGSVTATGSGTEWHSEAGIFVGGADSAASGGSGALHILNGGYVETPLLKQWSTGFVEVDNGSASTPGLVITGTTTPPAGAGTLGDFAVGNNGTGRMEITSGGQVYTSRGFMGGNAGSDGTALLSGAGSKWICNGSVYVGNSGNGTLTVADNALLSSAGNGYIAFANNTVGYATIANGGKWTTAGTLYIGGNGGGPGGSGTLIAADSTLNAAAYVLYNTGGLVIAGGSLRGPNNSSSVPMTINGGYVQAGTQTVFFNNCTLGTEGVRFYTAGNYLSVGGSFTGAGGITKGGSSILGAGTLVLTGVSTYTGATIVSSGVLLVRRSITSAVTVNNGGTLGGAGTVGGVTLNNNGVLSPGEFTYPDTITVNGNYTQTAGGILAVQLGGTSVPKACDRVGVSGSAAIGGTLNVSLTNGLHPVLGDTFNILTSNGLTGNFSTINSPGLILRSDATAAGIVLTVIGLSPSVGKTGSYVVSAGTNGVLDPGETVTVSLGVLNDAGAGGGCTTTALTGTLQETGGVTKPSAEQTYGALCAVSPGASRTFTFTVDPSLACGDLVTASLDMIDGAVFYGTLTYTFRVGSLVPATVQNFDSVTAPALPTDWSSTASGTGVPWVTSTTTPSSSPNDAFVPDRAGIGDSELFSPVFTVPADGAKLTFRNNYNTEEKYDGMVLEISINGDPFVDIIDAGGSAESGGYNATISNVHFSPIAGRLAWTGNSHGYVNTVLRLPPAANGQEVQLKWRMSNDESDEEVGAWIDDVAISFSVCGGSAPLATSAVSRKVHGSSGAFDIAFPGVECRSGGASGSHQVVVTFANPVSVSGVSVVSTDRLATATQSVSSAGVTVELSAVTNAQTLGITLFGVSDGTEAGDVFVPMGVLLGDTNGNGSVNAGDVGLTKAQSGVSVTAANFRADVNANGSINAGDAALVKSKSGTQLP